ncbi:MAG: hypothetical protein ACO2Z9_09800 [Crocinitomicaceae bacterium]
MKAKTYKPIVNTGHLKLTNKDIDIQDGYWIDWTNERHTMAFKRVNSFFGKRVYFLHHYGHDAGTHHFGVHIQLSYWENHKFLWLQGEHWIQQPENIKWLVTRLIPVGFFFSTLQYFFK